MVSFVQCCVYPSGRKTCYYVTLYKYNMQLPKSLTNASDMIYERDIYMFLTDSFVESIFFFAVAVLSLGMFLRRWWLVYVWGIIILFSRRFRLTTEKFSTAKQNERTDPSFLSTKMTRCLLMLWRSSAEIS